MRMSVREVVDDGEWLGELDFEGWDGVVPLMTGVLGCHVVRGRFAGNGVMGRVKRDVSQRTFFGESFPRRMVRRRKHFPRDRRAFRLGRFGGVDRPC